MSRTVNIHDAKTHFCRLVGQAARGETIIIAKAGKPVAKVVAISAGDTAVEAKRIGFLAGEIKTPDDFDHMGRDQIERLFQEGE